MPFLRHTVLVGLLVTCYCGVVQAQTNYDGVYRAPGGGVTGNAACGTTRFGYPVIVRGNQVSMQTVMYGTLEGMLGPNGAVSISRGNAILSGRITGNHFSGTYQNGRCVFAMELDKAGR
ncbi:MAG: hypothetical protein JOZ05_09815 [Acetobacteraceae bacterium]|nr:hypothetical protein [Acetobacteraceae bacterium]